MLKRMTPITGGKEKIEAEAEVQELWGLEGSKTAETTHLFTY